MENSEPVRIPVAGFAEIEGKVPVRNEYRNQELWLRELKSVCPEAVATLEASGWPLRDTEIASPAALFKRRDESGAARRVNPAPGCAQTGANAATLRRLVNRKPV